MVIRTVVRLPIDSFRGAFRRGWLLSGAPDDLRGRRHRCDALVAERIDDRVDHRRRRADRAHLAAALDAERVVRAQRARRSTLKDGRLSARGMQ